ncbi:substrate-binding domain-containing protein [Rhizobium sp. 32-5/1]|uniref:substrate-binding domain-containing protein n=1 Tax=Rhizobium sp. 32-5/1 TaxID=3019602 RepID=UPI00240E3205|nr:substrate-binding domain-containing protein [Rhizobium sp. 32-5/1]WEZ82441.1 substrate-binding domain-containing protein [Rhizobium sp. 32-5/1]
MKGIRRLAQHLDISIGTVSRALNGRPDVNEDTRKRVLEAAVELGYVPNQSGRSLRQGTTNTIGLMMESSAQTVENSDNFFMGVVDGAQSVFARHQLDLILLPCSTDEDPNAYLQRIVARRLVDAMIISATRKIDKRIDMLEKAKIPFIALGRSESGHNPPWLDLDFEGVASRAIDRLVGRGHRRIAIAVPHNEANLGYIFLDGYKQALARHGLAFDPDLVTRTSSSEQGGYFAADELLRSGKQPTAILLIYEVMAIGLYRRLAEAGIHAGRDFAVIGFRESPQSRFLSPPLTCFRLSLRDLGIALAESLLASMPSFKHHYPQTPAHRIWPMELVEGESDAFELPVKNQA